MVSSAKGKQDSRNCNRYFSIALFKVWYERNKNFLFLNKNYPQKQPFADGFPRRCSWQFCNVHIKTPVLESFFSKAVGLKDTFFYRTPSVSISVPGMNEFSMFTLFTCVTQSRANRQISVNLWKGITPDLLFMADNRKCRVKSA